MSKTWLVSSMKNEAPYILEWVAYHRVIGFDNILIYTNNNSDRTLELFKKLDIFDWFNWKENEILEGESPQMKAFSDAFVNLNGTASWVLVCDADEFLVLAEGIDLQDFLARHSDADCISVYWKVFGSSGQNCKYPGLTIERFQNCADPEHKTSYIFKSLTKMSKIWSGFGLHKPLVSKAANTDEINWIDSSGVKLAIHDGNPGPAIKMLSNDRYKLAQINHYMVKSLSEYRMKQCRGNGFITARSNLYNESYFAAHDLNESQENKIIPLVSRVKQEMANIASQAGIDTLLQEIEDEYVSFEKKLGI